MPKVSVIIPNYNHANYLKQRIDSVLSQTFQDFEIIILDDCSTDNSIEVINRYKSESRVSHIIVNRTNSGSPFIQWAKGISLAKGEYIWIAESDDYSENSFLEEAHSKMMENPSVGVVYANSIEIDVNGENPFLSFLGHKKFGQSFNDSYSTSGKEEIRTKLCHENTIPNASAVLFKKSIYEMCGGLNTEMKLCGDWLFWIKMLLHSDVYFIAKPLNYFRYSNTTVRSTLMWLSSVSERLSVYQFIENTAINKRAARINQILILKRVLNQYELTDFYSAAFKVISLGKKLNSRRYKIAMAIYLSCKDRLVGILKRQTA